MKKRIAFLIVAIAFSGLFFACEEEGIPVPLPPPLPVGQAETDSALLNQNQAAAQKNAPAKNSKEKPAAKKEAKSAPKQNAKPAAIPCTGPCDTDSEQLSSGRYNIQIAVLPSESSARSLVRRMSNNGIRAYYAQVENPAQLLGSYYRVRVGFFNGRSEAENFARTRLEPLGYAWWVDKRKNDKVGSAGASSMSFSSSPPSAPVDDELEAAKQAYREQLAREQAAAASQPQQSSGKKKKKKSRSNSNDDDFDLDE